MLGVEFDGAPRFYIHDLFFFSFLSLQLLCCCRWAFPSRLRTICTRNRFHGNDAQWKNVPKRPGVKAKGLVDFFCQTVGLWHSVSCLFVTELLRLPFSCYKFQLFAGDSVFFIIILKRIYAIYKQTHPPTRLEHCVYCQIFSSAESNLVAVGTSQLRIYLFYTQDEVGDGLCESFNGDFSRCIIENIFLDYQV